jgi:cytoskeletal protein CcmA (bactofilin family)
MYGSRLLNRLRERRGDTLYHCIFCRLQFYDPRKPAPAPQAAPPGKAVASPEPAGNPAPEPAPTPVPPRPAIRAAVPPAPAPRPPAPPDIGTLFTAKVAVRGSISSSEDLYLDGQIEGTLTVQNHRITIGPNAKVKATVRAAELDVRGTLRGNSHIQAKATLREGSSVVGDIKTADIVIEDGAHFKGSVDLIRTQPELPLV